MIEVRNLTKKYGNTKVVDNVSLDIEKGKMISLIGPNGAGKSTVLSMITRLMDMDEGQVIIDGTELSKWDSKELSKRISILKQANDVNLPSQYGNLPKLTSSLTVSLIFILLDCLSIAIFLDNSFLSQFSNSLPSIKT